MDIEDFYIEDERRRQSAEIELGTEWHDAKGLRYELSWVEDTGELYVMREPGARGSEDPLGGFHVEGTHGVEASTVEAMTVSVLATVAIRSDLDRILDGWSEAIGQTNSMTWLIDRLKNEGFVASV